MRNIRLYCTGCGREYPLGTKRCPCGQGVLRVILTKPRIKGTLPTSNAPGIWRYEAFLPNISTKISMHEGSTPLIPSIRLGQKLGVDLLYKDETRNPTGSFKDRAAAIMISAAKDLGAQEIVTASSGNAAGAISLYAALAGISAFVFMYKPTKQKLVQSLSYGATVFTVETSEEGKVLSLAEEASQAFDWALLNTTASANPFVTEGYKTIAYELYEQQNMPDWICLPVASGSLLIGLWQGLRELKDAGLLHKLPHLLGVQPANVAPISTAFFAETMEVRPIRQGDTIATALSLENPGVSGIETLKAIKESEGMMLAIPDDELITTARNLAKEDGIFGEASGVISVAGVIKAIKKGVIQPGEKVICVITGGGLKDPKVYEEGERTKVLSVSADLDSVRSVLPKLKINKEVLQELLKNGVIRGGE